MAWKKNVGRWVPLAAWLALAGWSAEHWPLLADCALWLLFPFLLWGAGFRARWILIPAVAMAGVGVAVAAGFLFLREVYFPRYRYHESVATVARGFPMDLELSGFYFPQATCQEKEWGKLCRDPRGQRIYEQPGAKGPGVLFLGCSFTDAEMIPDADTFVAVAGARLGRPVWSMAESGAAMSTMLFRAEHFEKFVPPELGFSAAVYTFIPQHLIRAAGMGSMRFSRNHPHYELERGTLRLAGTHFDFAGGERWVRKLGPEVFFFLAGLIPAQGHFLEAPPLPPAAVELAAAEVNRMAELFEAKYRGRFVLNLWPGAKFPDREEFLKYLSPRVIVWEAPFTGKMDIDGHPYAAYHRKMGEFLAKKLGGL